MKTIKVSEATGQALDWLVAKCEGVRVTIGRTARGIHVFDAELVEMEADSGYELSYSTEWAKGGPLLDKYDVRSHGVKPDIESWIPFKTIGPALPGADLLESGMRCIVQHKLGEFVEVPEELLA